MLLSSAESVPEAVAEVLDGAALLLNSTYTEGVVENLVGQEEILSLESVESL